MRGHRACQESAGGAVNSERRHRQAFTAVVPNELRREAVVSRRLRCTHNLLPWCNSYDYRATKESMWALQKQRLLSSWWWEMRSERRAQCALTAFRTEGPHEKAGGGFRKLRETPADSPRETRTWVPQPQATKSVKGVNEPGSWVLPQPPDESSPWLTPGFGLGRPQIESPGSPPGLLVHRTVGS